MVLLEILFLTVMRLPLLVMLFDVGVGLIKQIFAFAQPILSQCQ